MWDACAGTNVWWLASDRDRAARSLGVAALSASEVEILKLGFNKICPCYDTPPFARGAAPNVSQNATPTSAAAPRAASILVGTTDSTHARPNENTILRRVGIAP